ncbi:Uncharacterised protein [uncultured archaeon]|nr:Uncharacterised protein [uncultured archaeon]
MGEANKKKIGNIVPVRIPATQYLEAKTESRAQLKPESRKATA